MLVAGFALFDAGFCPALVPWLTVGSSLDRSGEMERSLWQHHFAAVLNGPDQLLIEN